MVGKGVKGAVSHDSNEAETAGIQNRATDRALSEELLTVASRVAFTDPQEPVTHPLMDTAPTPPLQPLGSLKRTLAPH